jgi:Holliday junction resolvase RusA-like endonuclease
MQPPIVNHEPTPTARWFHLPLNPEPWAVGSLGIGKRGGKMFPTMSPNPQLTAFKQAVVEELEGVEKLPPGEYELKFYFWRVLDDYETASGRRHRKHQADTTNLQKATEDALQGVLIDNDRNVRRVTSEIIEQGPDIKPRIVISADFWSGFNPNQIPQHMWDLIDGTAQEQLPLDEWESPEDMF